MNDVEKKLFDFAYPINISRQIELDLLKAISIALMIFCHTVLVLKSEWSTYSGYEFFFIFVTSIVGAQAFMICMGAGIAYSRSQQPSQLFKRGIILLALGYLLNILRNFFPMLITGHHPYFHEDLTLFDSIFEVDILQFAGLTFLFFGIIKRYQLSGFFMLATTLFCCAIGGFLNHLFLMNVGIFASLLNLFMYTNEMCSFPFFSWIIYPVTGYFFGVLLKNCVDKPRLYNRMFILGLALTLGMVAGCLHFKIGFMDIFTDDVFYGQNMIIAFALLSIAMLILSITYLVSRLLKTFATNLIKRWSGNLTVIYFISWIIFGWLTVPLNLFHYRDTMPQSWWLYLSFSVVVFMISDFLAVLFNKLRKRELNPQK